MSVTSNFKWGGKMLRISSHGIIPGVDAFVESDGSGFSRSPSQPVNRDAKGLVSSRNLLISISKPFIELDFGIVYRT